MGETVRIVYSPDGSGNPGSAVRSKGLHGSGPELQRTAGVRLVAGRRAIAPNHLIPL